MGSNTTALDPPSAAVCPTCDGEPGSASGACSRCGKEAPARGGRHPAAKAVIGLAWFCTAVVILWFFGSLAMAPWDQAARIAPMPLPGGAHLDLTLGRGATARCAVRVTRDGASKEVVIMQGACSTIAAHKWLTANRQSPQFEGATLGKPYTLAAPPGAEETATHTRLLVSCLFTVAAGLVGAFLTLCSVRVAVRLMNPRH